MAAESVCWGEKKAKSQYSQDRPDGGDAGKTKAVAFSCPVTSYSGYTHTEGNNKQNSHRPCCCSAGIEGNCKKFGIGKCCCRKDQGITNEDYKAVRDLEHSSCQGNGQKNTYTYGNENHKPGRIK